MQGLNLKCGLALVVMPWALLLAGASCDPCVQLSNLVCDCEPSANAQIACRQQRELQRSQRDEEDADPEICAAALETCSCEAMEQNDWEACGMTRDTLPETEDVLPESSQ